MNLMDAARNAVALAKPRKKEFCLVVTDKQTIEIGSALFDAASEKCSAVMMVIKPTGQSGREPPKEVADAMKNADIVFCPTEYSLTHTDAARNAKKSGAAVVTLPGITKGGFIRGLSADPKEMLRITKKVAAKLRKAKEVRVVAAGTDIVFKAGGRVGCGEGVLHRKSLHNLPSGEACFSPKGANGFFTGKDLHFTKKMIKFTVKNGKVVAVDNARMKKRLWSGKNRRNIAELGIGTNPTARVVDNVLEAEKSLGTCHIAVGDSFGLGGGVKADIHWDFIVNKPTIWFDGKKVMDKGRLL